MLTVRVVAVCVAFAAAMPGGCAAERLADGDHHVVFRGGAVRFTLENASPGKPSEPAVVFVHGWASARWFWGAQMDGLRGERRLIAIDLPGHGESDDVDDAHSFDLYAEAIAAVLDDAGVDRAVLVGHSNGTPTVRQFWRLQPDRTAGLVAVDGALRAFFDDPSEWEAFYEPMRGPGYRAWAEGFVGQLTAQMPDQALAAGVRETILSTPQRVMVGGFGAITKPGVWEEDPIGVPLLVINADAPFWDDEYEAFVRGLSPDVEYIEWAGVSHMVMMDRPADFNRTLLTWLERKGF